MSERFEAAIQFVLRWEGSEFTNDPSDHGGATRFGITQRDYDRYRQRQGKPLQSVRLISTDEVREIYQTEYWARVKGDLLGAPVDVVMFDTGVLMGPGRAARFLQTALGVEVDGGIGSDTLGALSRANRMQIATAIMDLREARLHAIVAADPTQERFLHGWLNRLNDLRRTVGSGHPAPAPDERFTALVGARGRAERDLIGDDETTERALPASRFRLLARHDAGSFLTSARQLFGEGAPVIFIVDTGESSAMVLRAYGTADAEEIALSIPVAAIESVVPLNVDPSRPTRIAAGITFRPEFASLAATFQQLSKSRPNLARAVPSLTSLEGDASDADRNDPGMPGPGEISGSADLATARILANLGAASEIGPDDSHLLLARLARREAPTMPLDIAKAQSFLDACMSSVPRIRYGLGAKVPFFGAVPGRDFTKVDCSGFVREAIRRATDPRVAFPDGSVVQHDWVKAQGYRAATIGDGAARDGVVRIAFLRPQDTDSGIGHVVLIYNGRTLESHGREFGPDARPWDGGDWQAKAHVYVLTA